VMAELEVVHTRAVMACIGVISSGKKITFSLFGGEGPHTKFHLELPNDQERRFQQLYRYLQLNPQV